MNAHYKKNLIYYKAPDIELLNGAYAENPEPGYFALGKAYKNGIKRASHWYHCRENFDKHFPETGFLFLNGEKGDELGASVATFIAEVENRLNLKTKTVISGFKNLHNVCYIKFSPWWKKNILRRQFFTILLRCGMNYNKSFENALYSDKYTQVTKEAVKLFFAGILVM
jgi:hypothetical protein